MVNTNVTTVTLSGETEVEFSRGYPYYWVDNRSDGDVYVSGSAGIEPEADGVYTVPAGEKLRIGAGTPASRIYLSGSGKVQINASDIASCPFKSLGKGGGSSGELEVSGLRHLYLAENAMQNYWKDEKGNVDINAELVINGDNSVTFGEDHILQFQERYISSCFTEYIVGKMNSEVINNSWLGFFNTQGNAPTIDICSYNKEWAIGSGASGYDILSKIRSTEYSVIAVVNCNGYVQLFINGELINSKRGYNNDLRPERLISKEWSQYYCIALYEGAHDPDTISTVSTYLANKYNLY